MLLIVAVSYFIRLVNVASRVSLGVVLFLCTATLTALFFDLAITPSLPVGWFRRLLFLSLSAFFGSQVFAVWVILLVRRKHPATASGPYFDVLPPEPLAIPV